MLVIGDVHGKVDQYWKILQREEAQDGSIQLGDFGFKTQHDWHSEHIDGEKHLILFGNHDYYPYLYEGASLRDFNVFSEYNMMTIRGADSIDKEFRIKGLNWFKDEEMGQGIMHLCKMCYKNTKPKIMITHDCPQSVRATMFGIYDASATSVFFDELMEIHKPDLWIFGHHHQSREETLFGTKFKCLDELEYYKIPPPKSKIIGEDS